MTPARYTQICRLLKTAGVGDFLASVPGHAINLLGRGAHMIQSGASGAAKGLVDAGAHPLIGAAVKVAPTIGGAVLAKQHIYDPTVNAWRRYQYERALRQQQAQGY